ncbi:unnamed protein product, partial [Nesidiocoris tenuis]
MVRFAVGGLGCYIELFIKGTSRFLDEQFNIAPKTANGEPDHGLDQMLYRVPLLTEFNSLSIKTSLSIASILVGLTRVYFSTQELIRIVRRFGG